MNPRQLSATLRRIAAAIDASKNPSKRLVAADLRRVIADVKGPDRCPSCRGTGFAPDLTDCRKCDGTGSVSKMFNAPADWSVMSDIPEKEPVTAPHTQQTNSKEFKGPGYNFKVEKVTGTSDEYLVIGTINKTKLYGKAMAYHHGDFAFYQDAGLNKVVPKTDEWLIIADAVGDLDADWYEKFSDRTS